MSSINIMDGRSAWMLLVRATRDECTIGKFEIDDCLSAGEDLTIADEEGPDQSIFRAEDR